MKKNLLSAFFAIAINFSVQSQALFAPITTTNYNLDGVAETTASSLTTSGALDGSNFVMHSLAYAALYSMSVGLPNNGLVSTTTKTFQLQPYTQNNILFLTTGLVDSLIIVTPAPYNAVSVIGMATEGAGTMNVTLRFTDNSIQTYSNIGLADWFSGAGNILNGFGRTSRTTGVVSAPSGAPNLYAIDFNLTCANRIKNLKSIKFSNTGTNPRLCIMGLSGASNAMVITNTVSPVTCQGGTNGSATITATGGTPPFNYTWSTTPIQTGNLLNSVPVGVYTYTLTDAGGCTTTNTVSITQSLTTQNPIFVSSNGTAVCLGSTVALGASGVNTYTWSNGSNSQIQIVTPSVTTTYSIIGYSPINCLISGSITIVVNPVPVVSLSSIPAQLCINAASFAINGSPTGGTLTGNNMVTGFSPSLAGVGTYSFNYIYTSTNNCSSSANATTIVNALPSVSLNLNAPSFCTSSSNFSLAGGSPSGGVYSGTGVSGTIFSPSVSGSGNFVIQYLYTDVNSCSNSATAAVSVFSLAAPSLSITKTFFCNNATNVFLTASPTNGTYTGVGLSGAGLFTPSQATIGANVLSYSISSGPCKNSSSITVTVSTCSGLKENQFSDFQIYPNPSNGSFIIEIIQEGSLLLYNQIGELVLSQTLFPGQNKIENTLFANGYYFAMIHTNGEISRKEIIIIR